MRGEAMKKSEKLMKSLFVLVFLVPLMFVMSVVVRAATRKVELSKRAEINDVYYQKQLVELSPLSPVGASLNAPVPGFVLNQYSPIVVERGYRGVANDTKELQLFREKFFAVKSVADLDRFLVDLDKNYETLSPNLKFISAQLLVLRPLRGFLWRMIPLMSGNTALHSIVLTSVKETLAGMRVFLPTEQWKVGFDFVSMPYAVESKSDLVLVSPFTTEAQFQVFLARDLYASLEKSAARMSSLDLTKPVVWDQSIAYGVGTFSDGMERFRWVGEMEKASVLSNLHLAMSYIAFQRAYAWNGMIRLTSEIGRLYGLDGLFFGRVSGAPAAERIKIIRSGRYPGFGVLASDGVEYMNRSFLHLKKAAEWITRGWRIVQATESHEQNVIQSEVFTAFKRTNGLAIENMNQILTGETQLRSLVTGKVVTVDLKKFYMDPVKDLKTLFAQNFVGGKEWHEVRIASKSHGDIVVPYRNYHWQNVNGWNAGVFAKYYPSIRTSQDVADVARTLSDTPGATFAAIPLYSVIR